VVGSSVSTHCSASAVLSTIGYYEETVIISSNGFIGKSFDDRVSFKESDIVIHSVQMLDAAGSYTCSEHNLLTNKTERTFFEMVVHGKQIVI